MDLNKVAKRLLESLAAPSGAVSAFPWKHDGKECIRVFIDPDNRILASRIPKVFDGVSIRAEPRKTSVAH